MFGLSRAWSLIFGHASPIAVMRPCRTRKSSNLAFGTLRIRSTRSSKRARNSNTDSLVGSNRMFTNWSRSPNT
ncbi:unnamed protein product [Nesidiocoris tenuis]|uniref:Uncharacterized protein n=1 Tax=Nesidiocoris tenuis TaxID=355587 RepID=A0A6H5GD49_9HEMI|nr:unnamed protein product [Nesidiocoris tenuis]